MNEHVLDFVLPDSAPVNSATLSIPNHFKFLNWEGHESLTDLTNFTRELNHILSLIPEEELDEADYEPNCGWHLFTTNQGAIKYAFDHGFLCEYCTACSSAQDQMTEGNVCKDCCSKISDYICEEMDSLQPEIKNVDGKLIVYYNKTSNPEKTVTNSNA